MRIDQLLPVAILISTNAAWGFSLETVATTGCHERITTTALSRSGWPLGMMAPAPSPDDQVLAQNLQFHAPDNADAWTLALLLGVRDNDLGGASPTDLPMLAAVQNGAGDQHDHCLRELGDTGADGDQHALAECRAYILSELGTALGDGDVPDLQQTEPHPVDLAFGNPTLPLSRYAFHLGNASHALEDSFAHTFRTADLHTVVSVLNYIGPNLDGAYRPDVDGYPHESAMDSCDDADEAAKARTDAATTAVSQLYDAVNLAGDRPARMQRANTALDSWFGYSPGCTAQNAWCGHVTPETGCSAAGGVPALAAALSVLLRWRRSAAKAACLATAVVGLAASAQPTRELPKECRELRAAPAKRGDDGVLVLGLAVYSTVRCGPSASPYAPTVPPASPRAQSVADEAIAAAAARISASAPAGSQTHPPSWSLSDDALPTRTLGPHSGTGPVNASFAPVAPSMNVRDSLVAEPASASPAAVDDQARALASQVTDAAANALNAAPVARDAQPPPAPPTVTTAPTAMPAEPAAHRAALHVATGLSIDNPALAVALGARLEVTRHFWLGLDVELAPWFDAISGRAALGTVDAFASAIVSWLRLGPVEVRSSVSAGTSVLLFAAEGASKGAVGVFLGTSLVQLAVHLSERLFLELSPEVMVAIPELKGVPLAYRQYRTSVGLQWLF